MDDHDAALQEVTDEIAALLAAAYLRLQLPQKQVDSSGDRERT